MPALRERGRARLTVFRKQENAQVPDFISLRKV